jgi:hypothetical protein
VVHHHQQPSRRVRAGVEEHRPHHHPRGGRQFLAGGDRSRGDGLVDIRRGQARHVDPGQHGVRGHRTHRLDPQGPARRLVQQAQPQRVVPIQQRLHRGPQPVPVGGWRHRQHQ